MTTHNENNGHSTELTPASGTTSQPSLQDPLEAESEAPQQHPLKKLHRLLRGRYHWAILLGGVLAAAGGIGGWLLITPMHEARGQLAIKTYLPPVMHQIDETGQLPMAEKFVGNQVRLIQSTRVVKNAIESEQWQPYSQGVGPDAIDSFKEKLTVERPRTTDVINVRFQHANEDAARAAVRAVIAEYQEVFQAREAQEDNNRKKVLRSEIESLQERIDTKTERIRNIAGEVGADTLHELYRGKVDNVQQLEDELQNTEVALASAGVAVAQQGRGGSADEQSNSDTDTDTDSDGDGQDEADSMADRWASMTVRQIARLDPHMQQLMDTRRSLEQQLGSLQTRLGPRHRRVEDVRAQLRQTQKSVDEYAKQFREEGPSALRSGSGGRSDRQLSVEQLRAKRQQLRSLLQQARQEMREFGRRNRQILDLKHDREKLQQQLEQTQSRLEQLNLESDPTVSGRIVMNDQGEIVPGIVNSGTRKQVALLGFMGGGGLGVGFVLLLGWRDRRLDNPEDMSSFAHRPRVLGMLPNLPKDLADPQNASLAAYAVHHIRAMLQLVSSNQGGTTLAISGPARENGKTSLTLGLGLSFASAGARTLLIDCDLAGGGLSRRLQTFIRRRLGQILHREGRLTQEQLEQALAIAERDNRRIGEVLMETGAIDEQTLASALDAQEKQSVGLLDALAGEPLAHCVADSGLDNLSVLPVGDAQASDTSRLSPQSLRRVIEAAREQFQVVLIDTGPIPGSVESGIAAGAADRAVLIVSRGEQQPDVERSLEVLHSIRVPLAGVVFNRANQRDLERAGQSSGSSRLEETGQPHASASESRLRTDRFDPVTRAVASAAVGTANGDRGSAKRRKRKRK